ncbi:class F sortase [Aestuariimicrobium sp. p3-SID1156]|uniref:class F sortase n=1 Tax=Aestuariimicrobium sp. p3-SID1156 TaxID=2916038 RepID=UPI00223AE692|nr:class F sortase [Aestuariimicrobium sp. p3-SID1156]MCT1458924.1 class F sortase [Aestuariimicrobium sp. p3-SID1156]
MNNRTKIGIGVLVLLLAVGGFLVYGVTKDKNQADVAEQSVGTRATVQQGAGSSHDAATASPSPTSAAPTRTSTKVLPKGCMTTMKEIEPTRFEIPDMKVTSPMIALGEDEEGAAAAPPKSEARTVGWWENGPKVGATQGKTVLTIHTYHQGGALGNQLYDKQNGFKTGDLVRMTDAQGQTQCYELEKETKVWVKDYDPNSDILYAHDGPPRAVIVICWDYNYGTKEWDSRILYYLKPLAMG